MNSNQQANVNERRKIQKAGSMHAMHWTVVILSLVLTVSAWYYAQSQVEAKSRLRFDREVEQVVTLTAERLRKYEDALWSGAAFVDADPNAVSLRRWQAFTSSLSLADKYPGINGLGIIERIDRTQLDTYIRQQQIKRPDFKVHPEHQLDELFPITFVEPIDINRQALGLDMAHEINRYTAAKKAGESGTAQITGPIVLVQDASSTPGFLFYVPYYKNTGPESAGDSTHEFSGLVYAPFVVHKLMRGTLAKQRRHVGIKINDGNDVLFDEHIASNSDFDPDPIFSSQQAIELYGRTWHFDVRSGLSFRNASTTNSPLFILVGGVVVDGLLLLLFMSLSRANRRTIEFADSATDELLQTTVRLQQSNEELEKFAYVASHDLKTPLRGISDLTEYLEEDLEPYLADTTANPDVGKNLKRIHQQTSRMHNLIESILKYSSLDRQTQVNPIDCTALVEDIGNNLGVSDQQLVTSQLPNFQTYDVLLMQVFTNLITNAFKYHDDQANARVNVDAQDEGEWYQFSITDNGPGIDPKFHTRIFEIFQTLQPKTGDSTGIGLSIVKKIVETAGGKIKLVSQLGQGATFAFTWPKTPAQNTA